MNGKWWWLLITAGVLILSTQSWGQQSTQQLKMMVVQASRAENETEYMRIMNSADSLAIAAKNINGQGKVNQVLGSYYYDKDADKSILYYEKAHELLSRAGNKGDAAFCLQNIATCYMDKLNDAAIALTYATRTLDLRLQLPDTMESARQYAFIAVLNGRLAEFGIAKSSAWSAIQLFERQKNERGIGDTYRKLGVIYELEEKTDSALFFLKKAKALWLRTEPVSLPSRKAVYGINSDLIRLATATGRAKDGSELVLENENANISEFHDKDKLEFYKAASEHFLKTQNHAKSAFYQKEYQDTYDKCHPLKK